MRPDILGEQNPALFCRLSLRPVDRESKSNLDGKLQAAEFKGETLSTAPHGNSWQNQNAAVVIRSSIQFLENKTELPNFLDQEPCPVAVTSFDVHVSEQNDHRVFLVGVCALADRTSSES